MQFTLKKEDFGAFIEKINKDFDVIAPIKGDKTKRVQRSQFTKIDSADQIHFDINSYFPAKYFFFDKKETILEINGDRVSTPKIELKKRVFFGLRRCDLNGIMHQDIVFGKEPADPFYKTRRDSSILIGMHCDKGDEFCFCNSVTLKDFYDLMFYEKENLYKIETGSKIGEEFIKQFLELLIEEETITDVDRKIENTFILSTTDIKDIYNHKGCEELAPKCIGCGACNTLCPNCHCFSVEDKLGFDLKTGKRIRIPASCQLKSFTRVAGNFVFRNQRVARYKHRIYHQLQYFKERHNENFCTGCARCIRGCPTRIDWVSKINEMVSKK